jgi:predicted acetyltransferase
VARATASESGRSIGIHEHGADGRATLVATTVSFPCRMVVPGGAVLPAAGVTRVGVRADRTRRGLLSAMMKAQLEDFASRGEVLASLRATEARIYGRFGYGVATRGREVRVRRIGGRGWRPTAPTGGSVRLLDRADVVAVLAPLHERIALVRAGGMTRDEAWWAAAVHRRIAKGEHVVAAVHTGADGVDDGFAIAYVRHTDEGFAAKRLRIEDLHATNPGAMAGLWRFLLDSDLVGNVEAGLRPLDESVELLLADARDFAVKGVQDEMWLRILDVPAALAARTYGDAEPVLLAVHDAMLEDNAGVYRIGDGTADRVGPIGGTVVPELQCDATALAMAYLGDRAPSELLGTGWWRPGSGTGAGTAGAAVQRADRLFATERPPWCGTFF